MFFEKLNDGIRSSEASVVNLLSAIAPWLAPLAPAYMTFSHLSNESFAFPLFVALAVSAVVEVLGLSAISTILSFWGYNRRRMAEYKKAPVGTAVFSFVMYLAVVLVMNVILDAALIFNDPVISAWVVVIARGFLTLLSIPAAMLLATRTQHREMIDTIRREKEERTRQPVKQQPYVAEKHSVPVAASNKKKQFLADLENGRIQAVLEQTGALLTAETLAEIYGVSVRTAFRWLKSIQ